MGNAFLLGFGKKGVSFLTIISMVATLSMPFLLYPAAAEATIGYAISITSPTVTPFHISIAGTASANPYVGNLTQQNVKVLDWGDSSPQEAASFTITSSSTSPPKMFTGNWSASHTYAAVGPYTIMVAVCHQSCNSAQSADGSVTINVVIPPATLTVIKHVSNTNGGTAVASNFTINVTGPGATPASFPGSETGTTVSLNPGNTPQSYSVSEVSVAGYTGSSSADCAGTIASGQSKTCTITNTDVADTTPPVIAPHANVTVEATSSAGAIVAYTPPNATDNVDATAPATCTPTPGSTFALGTTPVTCTKTDAAGNSATPTMFNVIVHDTTAPVITLNGNASVTLHVGDSYTELGATATDAVDGTDTVTIGGDTVVTTTPATFHINYNATDAAGNPATQVIRTVTVVDVGTPIINPIANITAEATSSSGAVVTYGAVTATDDVDGTIPATCTPVSGSTFSLGTTNVNCTATDSSLNVGTGVGLTVTVQDTTAPVITLNGNATVNLIVGGTYTELGATATDTVDGTVAVIIAGDTVVTTSPATFHVTYDATDAAGNDATQVVRTVVVGPMTHTLTYTAGANGTITGTSPQTVNDGADGTAVTAVANSGFHFVDWSDESTQNPRTDINVTADVTVTANFQANPVTPTTHTLTYTAGANGTISGTSPQTVNDGTDGSAITAVANSGFHFQSWSDAKTQNPRTDTNVTADISVTASFAPDQVSSGGGGGGGGGGGAPWFLPNTSLIIYENTVRITSLTPTSMTIAWETNLVSSSYVLYATNSESHTYNSSDSVGTPPQYGYAHATSEFDINPKVTLHSVAVSGLTPNTAYNFRVVSRGSFAASQEYSVSTPAVLGVATTSINPTGNTGSTGFGTQSHHNTGSVEGATTENSGDQEIQPLPDSTEPAIQASNNQTAAVGQSAGAGAFLQWLRSNWLWLLILLIILAVIYYYYRRAQQKQPQ